MFSQDWNLTNMHLRCPPPNPSLLFPSSESNRPTRCLQGASTPVRACTARRWPRPTTPETAAHSRPPPPGLGTARCPKAIPASSPSASPSPRQTTWPNSTSPSHFWIKQKSTKGEAVKLSSVSCYFSVIEVLTMVFFFLCTGGWTHQGPWWNRTWRRMKCFCWGSNTTVSSTSTQR